MSVPKSKRKTSGMQYIETANKIAVSVFRLVKRLPKRYNFLLSAPVFNHAEQCVYECKAANITYVKDKATYNQRRAHLTQAEAHLLEVDTLLGILLELTLQLSAEGECKEPNPNVYGQIADLIIEERKLIKGIKKKDTEMYNKSLKQET